jgi:hypothetical protein
MERQRKIALGLSACPPTLTEKAGVYVFEASGYVKVRESKNGFAAIAQHSVPDAQEPQCMDAESMRTILPVSRRSGSCALRKRVLRGSSHLWRMRSPRGCFNPQAESALIIYMLSTENVVPDENGVMAPFPPLVMFYAPFLTTLRLARLAKPAAVQPSSPLKAPPTPSS